MRRILAIAALLIAAAPFAAGQTPDKPAQPTGEKVALAGAEQAVTGRVNEFFAALRKGDATVLNPFYADDYTLTVETGAFLTKAQRLEWLKSNTSSLASVEPSDLKVRVYGDAAVVTGHVTIKGEGPAVNERFMQVWVKQGDAWRMVAGQITNIAPAQPAAEPMEKKP